eukprot:tig00000113_g5687.t1
MRRLCISSRTCSTPPVDVVLRLLKTTVFQNLDAENMEFVLEKRHDGTSEELEDISLLCSTSGWKTGKQGVYYTAMAEVAAPAEPAQRAATFGVRFSGRSSQGLADAVASSGRGALAIAAMSIQILAPN